MTIEQLPISGHLTPKELTQAVIAKHNPKDLITIGLDEDGYLFMYTSKLSYETTLWLLERSKCRLFENFERSANQ